MVPLKELTAETVLSDDVLTEVFDQEDELYKSRLLLSLEDRAIAKVQSIVRPPKVRFRKSPEWTRSAGGTVNSR